MADPGWVITRSRSSSAKNWTKGTHGYSNQLKAMWPIFFATGPAFREGFKIKPFSSIDLYPLMCHVIGVEPRPHDGSFDRVKLMLKEFAVESGACKPAGNSLILLVVALAIATVVNL